MREMFSGRLVLLGSIAFACLFFFFFFFSFQMCLDIKKKLRFLTSEKQKELHIIDRTF